MADSEKSSRRPKLRDAKTDNSQEKLTVSNSGFDFHSTADIINNLLEEQPLDETQDNDLLEQEGIAVANLLKLIEENVISLREGNTDVSARDIESNVRKLSGFITDVTERDHRLTEKCKKLSGQLKESMNKAKVALQATQLDQQEITTLKNELEKTWKMLQESTQKEYQLKENVTSLTEELELLRYGNADTYQSGRAKSPGEKMKLVELQMAQDENIRKLTDKNGRLEARIVSLGQENKDLSEKVDLLLQEKMAMDIELSSMNTLLSTRKSDMDRELKNREKLEVTIKQTQQNLALKETEAHLKTEEAKHLKTNLSTIETQLKQEKALNQELLNERDALNSRVARLSEEFEEQSLSITRLISETQAKAYDISVKDQDLKAALEEVKNLQKTRDSLNKRIKSLEEDKFEIQIERDKYKGLNISLTHDLDSTKKELDRVCKEIESLSRERDVAQKNFVKASGATQKQVSLIKISEQTKRNLEHEIAGHKEEAAKMRKLIFSLEKDRDRHMTELNKVEQEHNARIDEIKMLNMQMLDAKKKVSDYEKKLKEQQALYEGVRADRNISSKNLVEAQDEISEMRRKIKIMTHQIDQLKEELSIKDNAMTKEHFERAKLEKDKENLSLQIAKLQSSLEEKTNTIQNIESEQKKLKHTIAEVDIERQQERKEYEIVVQERDILGTQLIRRNDELSLLYEKIKIQTSTLDKGEVQYRERLEDIRVLRLEIKRLRREGILLQNETQNTVAIKNELFKLQRELLKERTRTKVLEEELESPMNIHRWRKLAGSDPSTFELITKIQTLQKRLISKTEDVVEKELLLDKKEKLYKEIKDLLKRTPGPEVMEELRSTREAFKSKNRECKALASELNMFHAKVSEYKYEVDHLSKELQAAKKRIYEFRRKERQENPSKFVPVIVDPRQSPTPILGAGFKVNRTMANESPLPPLPFSVSAIP